MEENEINKIHVCILISFTCHDRCRESCQHYSSVSPSVGSQARIHTSSSSFFLPIFAHVVACPPILLSDPAVASESTLSY